MFVVLMIPRPPISTLTYTLFPFTTLFRSIPDLGCPYDISEPVTGGLYKLPNVLIQCRRKPLPPATLCNPPCGYPKYILPEDPNFCVLEDRKEHTSELQSLMRISYAVFCLKKKQKQRRHNTHTA